MAESWRAKANRYSRGDFTKAELTGALGVMLADQLIDVATFGRISKLKGKAFLTAAKRLAIPAVTTTGRIAGTTAMGIGRTIPTVARGVKFVTMRHPYIAAAVVTYEIVKNREQIAQLAREGWEIVEPAVAPIGRFAYETAEAAGVYDRPPGIQAPGIAPMIAEKLGFKVPKRKSKYNRAMSKAMKAVKASSKGGKKGTLSNPKSVFKTVSKAVSKVNRGARVGTTGITGIAARAARKIIKTPKKKVKKGTGRRY
jgi:hypothetical protein